MAGTSGSEILAVWEGGVRQSLAERALTLLGLAEPPLATPGSVSVGQRDAELFRIRQRLFGDCVEGVVSCGACGEELDLALSLDDLLRGAHDVVNESISIDSDGWRIRFRIPTGADLARMRDVHDVDRGVALLVERCLIEASHDGEHVQAGDLPEHLRHVLDDALTAADPLGNVTLVTECPCCGVRNEALFDVPSLLWHETHELARDVLSDVHVLASAYGWDEATILALGSARRRFYLDSVQA